ncbi:MAG: AGE family epimerase/isomerase [Opitutaceae bacterium]|nr:AGE family epimerase/isomerase [Opitutaceae bacterium]
MSTTQGEQKPLCLEAIKKIRRERRSPMAAWLRRHLFDHVLPFWERHAFDDAGGLCTCIGDAGNIVSGDKWLWSQWRAVWVFSRIYRKLDPDKKWLRHAEAIAAFCERHGWDETEQGWVMLVDPKGRVLRGCDSTYIDAFAVYALTEQHSATDWNASSGCARAAGSPATSSRAIISKARGSSRRPAITGRTTRP